MVVAAQLGHRDSRLVLQRYGHLYPGAAAQAAMALDPFLQAQTDCWADVRANGSGEYEESEMPRMLMERAGLEPATPSLQSWCSPN